MNNTPRRKRVVAQHLSALMGDPVEMVLGRLRQSSVAYVADQAARVIADLGRPLAVTLDPRGHIALEEVSEIAEEDLVGVYSGAGIFTLSRAIYRDLRSEIDLRAAA